MKLITKSEKYTRSLPRMAVVGGSAGIGAHYGGKALANATGQSWMGHALVPVVAAFSAVALTELALWYFSDEGQDAAIRLSDAFQEAREAAKDADQRKAMKKQLKDEGYSAAQIEMFMFAITNEDKNATLPATTASSDGDLKELGATLREMVDMMRTAMEAEASEETDLRVAPAN